MKRIILSAFLVLITSVVFAQVQNYNVGDVVDDFTVTDTDGNTWNLYDLTSQGKYVYLDFFFFQGLDEAHVADAGGHDIGHGVGLAHGVQHFLRPMAEAQHAVSATIVNYCAFYGDNPGALGRQGHVGIDGVLLIEVCETILGRCNLGDLIHGQ